MSATSFFGGQFFGGEFFNVAAADVTQGGGTSRFLRRGRIPKRYSDIPLEQIYRELRGEAEPPKILVEATQRVAEGLADPSFPEVDRDELATTLIPFMAKAGALREQIDWVAVVQDREAMQRLIQMQMAAAADEDEDEDFLLTVH